MHGLIVEAAFVGKSQRHRPAHSYCHTFEMIDEQTPERSPRQDRKDEQQQARRRHRGPQPFSQSAR
jgi:hypothetical protein